MKTTAMMTLLASSVALTMAATTPAPAPTTGGSTPATAGAVLCTAKAVDNAWDAFEDAAEPSGKKCALDAGVTDDALENMVGVTPAQLDLIAKSANCATYYTFVQKALASVQPPCALTTIPKTTTTADMAAFTIQQYTDFFKASSSASANASTIAPGSNTTTSVPGAATTKPTSVSPSTGSSAGTSTKAPTPKPTSGAASLTTGLVALATVAVAAM